MQSYAGRTVEEMARGGLSGDDVSDDESLEAYDGFAGDDTDAGVVLHAV